MKNEILSAINEIAFNLSNQDKRIIQKYSILSVTVLSISLLGITGTKAFVSFANKSVEAAPQIGSLTKIASKESRGIYKQMKKLAKERGTQKFKTMVSSKPNYKEVNRIISLIDSNNRIEESWVAKYTCRNLSEKGVAVSRTLDWGTNSMYHRMEEKRPLEAKIAKTAYDKVKLRQTVKWNCPQHEETLEAYLEK